MAARAPLWRRAGRIARRHWATTTIAALSLALVALFFLPVRLVEPLGGDWWMEGSPFERLRWFGDTPEVRIDGRWYGLVSIEGLRSGYVVGFTQQHADLSWRKRFGEDLVQVLNRMGEWTWRSVDLELRDLETGAIVSKRGVPLRGAGRRAAQIERSSWPFEFTGRRRAAALVRFDEREWELVSVEGVGNLAANSESGLYDELCDRVGRSPAERVDFVLRELDTGEPRSFEDLPRFEEGELAP